jgi:WD40 repeat protein
MVNKICFKPNENILFSSGQDNCFKSWTLQQSKIVEETSSWTYNTSNGYRELAPTDIEFIRLNSGKYVCCVVFKHIVTLWLIDLDGSLIFLNDLIHCDASDCIDLVKTAKLSNNYLLVVHKKCLNLWKIEEEENADIQGSCIWSASNFGQILHVHPIETGFLLISRENEETLVKVSELNLKKKKANKKDEELVEAKIKEVRKQNLTATQGPLKFICLSTSKSQSGEREALEIYYCDNRGILKQMVENEETEVVLNEQMWANREKVIRTLPETGLARILGDTSKAAAAALLNGNLDKSIDETRNFQLESNLKKVKNNLT